MKLVVALGNPDTGQQADRHNVGQWLLARYAERLSASGQPIVVQKTAKCFARTFRHNGVLFAYPTTYMNASGKAVAALMRFFKVEAANLLVLHDELDLPPGTVRLKHGGGHGGHNGLRDIIAHIGNAFWRCRIGIGHPGNKHRVAGYVLSAPSRDERTAIDEAIGRALSEFDAMLASNTETLPLVMNRLHTTEPPTTSTSAPTPHSESMDHGL